MPYTLLDDEPAPKQKGYVLLDDAPKNNGVSDNPLIGAGVGVFSGVGKASLNLQDLAGKGLSLIGADKLGGSLSADAEEKRKKMEASVAPYRENSPISVGSGELAGEIGATLPVGGIVGKGIQAASKLPMLSRFAPELSNLAESATTSGMRAGNATGATGLATRIAGGAATGGASAGLLDPDSAGTGALIGGALPPALKVVGGAGKMLGGVARKVASSGVSDDVAALANRAKELGIDIPADRIANSKPLNAIASGLNYVPFSGRAASEELMNSQLNRAVSKTFGQDSPNVTMALRKANDQLGAQFDHTLKNNGVKFDDRLLNDITDVYTKAEKELGSDALKPITNQINELFDKGQSGIIDGQAAYNIKKTLDRIGKGSSNEAFHARELKDALMDSLDRSLGPDQAAAFAKTRQQYGNMRALEKLAPNGVEGELSAARLANMRNINNQPLQELADIAAQFVKPREGQHGAMQRGAAAVGIGSMTGLPGLAATMAGGRGANAALNSQRLKSLMTGQALDEGKLSKLLGSDTAQKLILRSAPVVSSQ